MQRIKFPDNWLVNIDSISALAGQLQIPAGYLQSLRRTIPRHYRYKELEKRTLRIPDTKLKDVQRVILEELLTKKFPPCVHGGVHGRSIKTNAEIHAHNEWIMKLDIANFFPSVNYRRIENVFLSLGYAREVAEILTQFTTCDEQLPQGAPTSPALANLVLYKTDRRIDGLCHTMRFVYSRYFDDITISGSENPEKIFSQCKGFVQQENFTLNEGKKETVKTRDGCVVAGIFIRQGVLSITPELKEEMYTGNFSIYDHHAGRTCPIGTHIAFYQFPA